MADEEREYITKERALELIGDKDSIHVILNPGVNMMIGADWSRKELEKLLDTAQAIEIGGEQCRRMNHPIVAFNGKYHFIEAKL